MKDSNFRPLNENEKFAVVNAKEKRKIPTDHPLYVSLDHAIDHTKVYLIRIYQADFASVL